MMQNANATAGRFPGLVLRAWALFTGAGVLVSGANVASVNRTGTGTTTVNFTTALPSVNYLADWAMNNAATVQLQTYLSAKAVGSCTVNTVNSTGATFIDADLVYVGFYG